MIRVNLKFNVKSDSRFFSKYKLQLQELVHVK